MMRHGALHSADLPGFGLTALLLGAFLTIFDTFVVNIALPSIRATFQADFGRAGLVIVAYELGFGGCLLLAGRLGDAFGSRRLFRLGIAAFIATSLWCGAAPRMEWLILGRLLQGVTAALFFPQIYAFLRRVGEAESRHRLFARLGMTLGLAAIAGQVLGGLLIHADVLGLGWRAIFLINLPLGLLILLGTSRLPRAAEHSVRSFDVPGALLGTLGLWGLFAALLEGPERHWPSWTVVSLTAGLALLALLLVHERRLARAGGAPLIDPGIFHHARLRLGLAVVLIVYASATALFLSFAILVQAGLGLSAFAAGLTLSPASLGFVGASLLAPRLRRRLGESILIGGGTLYAGGFLLLSTAVAHAAPHDAWPLVPALVVLGIGQGLTMPPLLNFVLASLPSHRAGMASGLISTTQKIGGTLGVAVAGLFLGPVMLGGPEDQAHAFAEEMQVLGGAALIATLLVRQATTRERSDTTAISS
ncbi:MFS transporter [Halomonas koreensis]|uniref:MFS transporter n=1 Tax=Halomonas koreensis TaxID=245385 RepID=A0ABU1G0Q0_9GAMM|nr:MFS transporter [Halomonas koreensis]MDR5866505.1 MFS transporter [Halomonas koreensis]